MKWSPPIKLEEPFDRDYSTLLELVSNLIEVPAGQTIPTGSEWLNDAQALSIKLFQHLYAIAALANGQTYSFKKFSILFIDHSSIKVLARAAFETYLIFSYIYGNSHPSVSRFRHKTWELGGLIDRQKFPATNPTHIKIVEQEKEIVQKLRNDISKDTNFVSLKPDIQKKILQGSWRTGKTWADLAEDAGVHKKYFKHIYRYLSEYSHSGYGSALQIAQSSSFEDQVLLTKSIIGIGCVIMAHFIATFPKVFIEAANEIEKNPIAKAIHEKWHFTTSDMAQLYGDPN
ncbi:DUF5677 domain-containing protein [Ferrovibrio sp.]|uniref:DUF5677 domain-containing protein n=1 Tax=Ferrovibrio sp. TaxID=1917215 RepID=UPI0025B96488|nr:DUF5677 domain-containing protein [Ferrovibrio sp.]MBX3452999.1 hypothetical protein [Ferrovibrio sp.]